MYSIYFAVTIATTVGYGDISPGDWREKTLMIFLEFFGICIFSLISGRIRNLKWSVKVSDLVKRKTDEIETYIHDLDDKIEDHLDNEIYDKSLDYIKTSYLEGVTGSLREYGFYKMLNP